MHQDDEKIHRFKVQLAACPDAHKLWRAYVQAHGWPKHWNDVSEEWLDEAFAWLERMKTGEVLRIFANVLNLPEEERR